MEDVKEVKNKPKDDKKKWNFSRFKTQENIVSVFGTKAETAALTPVATLSLLEPSEILLAELGRAQLLPLFTEQAVRESLIFPVLIEIFERFQDKITLFSGPAWKAASAETPLNGVCDYLIGGRPRMRAPETPMICVVEAKKQDFESGTWQCAAELYACKINNELVGEIYPFYFGGITTGYNWNFIKLDVGNNLLICDTHYYALENLPRLLGAWKWIIETQLAAAPHRVS